MMITVPTLKRRSARLVFATTIVLALAAAHVAAQYGSFSSANEGAVYGVRHDLPLGPTSEAGGVALLNGKLYAADRGTNTVHVFDAATGAPVALPGPDWDDSAIPTSPVHQLKPNGIAVATVNVDGNDQAALLVSDTLTHRVLAFDELGTYLFTMRLDRPGQNAADEYYADLEGAITGLAMGPNAKFVFTSGATPTLALVGGFAAGWVNEYESDGAFLAYKDQVTIGYNPTDFWFELTPDAALDGTEGANLPPPNQLPFGVVFDALGNLYTIDTNTERLNVYSPSFAFLFAFGTPVFDGTLAEFNQPYGLAYSPVDGGRIYVGDSENHRVEIYRPNLAGGTLDYISSVLAFGDDYPRSVAVDTAAGRLAVSDLGVGRVWVLETPNLAAYNVRVLTAAGAPAEQICAGAPYQVRFSLTVPAGRAPVTTIVPQLFIDDVLELGVPVPSGVYADPLSAGQVATYTYSLVMPPVVPFGGYVLKVGATSSTANVLFTEANLNAVNCVGALPTITATESLPRQVSGWTPVPPAQTFSVTLTASDVEGVQAIEYELIGQNDPGTTIPLVDNDTPGTTQVLTVPLPEMGLTSIRFRSHDTDNQTSDWQRIDLRLIRLTNRQTNENTAVTTMVGLPVGVGYTFSATGLPLGLNISAATGQISGVVSFNAAGVNNQVYHVVLSETLDAVTTSVAFDWTIINVNRPPVIDQPVVPSAVEGQLFTLDINGSDPDGDPSFFTLNGRSLTPGHETWILPESITIDPVSGVISGIFPPNADRQYEMTVGLAECNGFLPDPPCGDGPLPGQRLATLLNIVVSVLDVNLPPSIVNPGDRLNAEGDWVSLPTAASDPDGDTLTFAADRLPSGLTINSETGLISGTIAYNAAGTYAVTIEVDDDHADPVPFQTFEWVVTDTPRIAVADQTDLEDTSPVVQLDLAAPVGAPFVISMSGLPAGFSVSPTGVVTGYFDFDSERVYPVTVTVTDADGSDTVTFNWNVLNVNRPPVLVVTNLVNLEGDVVARQIEGSDPDGDPLTFSMNGLPNGFVIGIQSGVITGTFSYTSADTYSVNVGLVDGQVGVTENFDWLVTDVNRLPIVLALPDRTNAEADPVSFGVSASDPDGNTLSYSALNLPDGVSINPATGAISGTLSYSSAGTHHVQIRVFDGLDTTMVPFTWTVTPVNRPPTVTAPDRTNAENDTVTYSVTAADPDLDTLTFSATGLPPGITINTETGVMTGTLGYSTAAGSPYSVVVTVSDGSLTADAPFTWTVTDTNAPPVITNPGPLTHAEGATISLGVSASDEDGQSLSFSATNLPPGLTMASNGQVTGLLGYEAAGSYTVIVAVDDGVTSRTMTFVWTITPVNRPPTVSAPNRSNAENDTVSYAVTGSDPDGDVLTYSATGLPLGISIHPNTGVISGYLGYTTAGTYNPVVTVSDGPLSATAPFVWVVTNTNRPPTAVPDSATVVQGQSTTISVLANDIDQDGVASLSVVSVTQPANGSVVINANGTVTYTSNSTYVGSVTFSYTITDGAAASTATVTVNVTPNNRPPVCSAATTNADMWPPNHRKVYITVTGVTDPDGGTPTIRFTSIVQDEPTDSVGQGHTMQDGGIENNGALAWVRAERSGTKKVPGDGRVYLIGFTATDAAGASCEGTVRVDVPHDQRGTPAVLSPGRWNSLTGQQISGPAPVPVAENDSFAAAAGRPTSLAVLSNDEDNGQALTISIVSQPSKGSVTVNSNGTITYTPPSNNWSGTTTFVYRIRNAAGVTDTAVVTLTVSRDNDDDDDDNCGDSRHDHKRDSDKRDKDHKKGDHERCSHGKSDRDKGKDRDKDDKDRDRDGDHRDDDRHDDDDDRDCGDSRHDHDRDSDNRDRDHYRGNHDRCYHRR